MILLDTNVVSELMRPEPDAAVLAWSQQQPLGELAITAITMMEVRYGIARLPDGARKNDLEARFRRFLALGFGGRVLPFDGEAAEFSAVLRAMRRCMGRAVSTEDSMIAGIARQQGATVVTRDESGFEGYGVPVINPWAAAS
ncbi:MAG: type II toxin-antitoxin system VapC family toxin [Parvibaculaceae bacterium]